MTLLSTHVYALENGECATPALMNAKLKDEDQHSFATANRVDRHNNLNTLYGIIVTISSDRKVGYILESDKPIGERATSFCVRNRLADIRVFDARKPGIPKRALLKASDADGDRQCAALIKAGKLDQKTCGPYNSVISKGEKNGERIMLQGFNVVRQPDGSYRKDGAMTTVTGNVNGTLTDDPKTALKGLVCGIFFTSLPQGATIINAVMVYADYTPYGLSLLDR